MGIKTLRYPWPVRVTHWLHAFGAIGVVATGLWISNPFSIFGFKNVGLMHEIHMDLVWILYGTLILRIFYAFVSGDWRDFIIRKNEWKFILPMVKYYLFLIPNPPPFPGKYNPLQKLSITTEFLVIIILFPAGAPLFWPTYLGKYYERLGLTSAVLQMVVYYLSIVLAVEIATHIYLTTTENFEHYRAMWRAGYADETRSQAQKNADNRNKTSPPPPEATE